MKANKERLIATLRLFFAILIWFAILKLYSTLISKYIDVRVSDILSMWINNIIVPYGIAFPILWFIIKDLPTNKSNYENKRITKVAFIKLVIIQSGIGILILTLVNVTINLIGHGSNALPMNFGGEYLIFNLFLLLIFNPIAEEFMYRKIILERLLKWGKKYAILVSAVLFSLVHFFSQGIPVMIFTFFSGCIWGYVTVKTGKITLAVIFHSLLNLWGIFLPIIFPQSKAGDFMFMLIWLGIIPCLAIFLSIRDWKKKDSAYFKT